MTNLFNRLAVAAAMAGALVVPVGAVEAARSNGPVVVHRRVVRRERHPVRKSVKRVGIGAAGGAAAGALIGGGPGAAVGAVVGGGAGAIYDHHEKKVGK